MIDEQVLKQLDYLKSLVDGEIKHEADCKKWGIRYEPSRTKWTDIYNYESYKKELDKNGDKNLLVIAKLISNGTTTLDGKVLHFARRYVGSNLLKHTTKYWTEVLVREENVERIE